ncbi:MAG TPA: hypothetical protein VGS59_00360 [Candidatus Acidoferrales bacterium]|nr:hypothetical protein [Candidatus Acidoferrales bacterium]
MNRKTWMFAPAILGFAILCTARLLFAQDAQPQSSSNIEVTITARAKRGASPALTARDVTVHEDKNPRPVVSLDAVGQADDPLQLMILVDSDATPRLGAQFQDISRFIQSLPQNAQAGLAYATSGSAQLEQAFTTDRAAITKALHVTFGPAVGNTSIYGALSDLIRKWPGGMSGREVLLISDGIDPTYGVFDTQPDQNPGLQKAIRDAERGHVTVFSIFVGSGRATRNQILNLNGQGSLGELTSDTGGYSFTQGTETPVSFRPFLNELQTMLGQQYLLTFNSMPSSKSGFHDIKVNTEVSGVKILAPKRVYLPEFKH